MTLRTYIIRRVLIIIPMFLISTIIVFSLIHLAPGDPIDLLYRASGHPPPPEVIEQVRKNLGLDQPIYIQYFMWISRMLRGDFGISYHGRMMGQPVITLISSRITPTLELMLTALFVSLVLSVVLGVIAAVKHYSIFDNICSLVALFGYSMPSFWIALILILILSLHLGLFPIFGANTSPSPTDPLVYFIDHVWHLILPVSVVSTLNTAYLFRLVRSSMLEVLRHDYITTARSKGLNERIVIFKHALKNALLPVITFVGLSIGFILTGAVVVETIFSWPGLGQLLVNFALGRDYSGIMGLSMIIILMVYFANLCADIAYAMIDPRIKY